MLSGGAARDTESLFGRIDFSAHRRVIAAVSGGSDSTALLVLLQDYLKRAAPNVDLAAVTVDHGLRKGSKEEAWHVAWSCANLGIVHRLTTWTGQKPTTGLPAAARDARYRLLAKLAEKSELTLIFLGHTADDQAETVYMRQQRGDGLGLAGMAPATLLDSRFWLIRPLLDVRRATLRGLLRDRQIGWIDDPTNENLDYERVRARRDLNQPGDVEALLAKANTAAVQRIELGLGAADFIEKHASQPAPGLIRLSFQSWPDDAGAFHALRLLLAVIGGRRDLPPEDATNALLAKLAGGARRATLSRTIVDVRTGHAWLYRENRGLPTAQAASNGAIWDGRFRLDVINGASIEIAPGSVLKAEDATIPAALRQAAAATQPSFRSPGGPTDARAVPIAAPWVRFLPSFDLAPATAILRLIGGDLPPPLPYTGHSEVRA